MSCSYAHGDDQLRTLTDPMPMLPPNVLLYNPPNLRRKETEAYTLAGNSRFNTSPVMAAELVGAGELSADDQSHPVRLDDHPLHAQAFIAGPSSFAASMLDESAACSHLSQPIFAMPQLDTQE